jgi:hypothetical protein
MRAVFNETRELVKWDESFYRRVMVVWKAVGEIWERVPVAQLKPKK